MSDFSVTIQMILVIFLIASAIGVSVTRKLFMAVIVYGQQPYHEHHMGDSAVPGPGYHRGGCWRRDRYGTVLPDAEEGSRTERHKGGVMR